MNGKVRSMVSSARLLVRLNSRVDDKRYGFLFQAPSSMHEYDAMADIVTRLLDYAESKPKIKIIDFSEVPAGHLTGHCMAW